MAPKLPKLSSVFEYGILSIPLYIFIISPLLRIYFPSSFRDLSSPPADYKAFEKTDALVIPDPNLVCESSPYKVRILSREPPVIYVENFLSDHEVAHIVDTAQPHFTPSTIHTGDTETFDPTIRNSSKALLPRDRTVQCVEQRAREFQGWLPDVYIERLWAQKYNEGGHYTYHFDWSGDVKRFGAGRLSTFMVYLGDDGVVGGGTRFPRLTAPTAQDWCELIECTGKSEEWQEDVEATDSGLGITFKPIKGNAIYWENFRPDGRGYEETWHAGLPVKNGAKYGLNIWSWYQPGYADER